ncbi:MAG: sigma-70 family RNA polymerase sigma factor [Chloroflexota bacterium]|nr:sigma-70 family RNA polymerase sigma factor [Chloroflexota bacterium]
MDGVQPEDEELLAQVGRGDENGLSVLYDRYARVVYSLILRVVQNRQVSEELTQEVFLRVWQQASTFHRDKGRFASWLFGIAHHIAIDELRRRKARPQQVYDDPSISRSMLDVTDGEPEPEEIALGGIRREYIIEALSQLPENQREVLELSYFGGLTQSQIAERRGEPLGTIKTRTRLGLQRLRSNLLALGLQADTL